MKENEAGMPKPSPRANMRSAAYIAAVFLVVFALQAFLSAYKAPRDALLAEPSAAIERDGVSLGTKALPILISCTGDASFQSGGYVFHMKLRVPGAIAGGENWAIVFPQMAGSSLAVTLNGLPIGVRGDPKDGRSSIWNAVHVFPVPAGLLSIENTIDARIAGTYEAGITVLPYLIDANRHGPRLFLLMLFSNGAIWLSMGAILAFSIIVLSMGIFNDLSRLSNILLGIAGIAVAVFLADFVYLERLPISLVAFKKIVVSLRHLSAALFVIAYLKLLDRKPDIFAIIFTAMQLACFALVLVYPGDIVAIKRLYGYTYLAFLPLQTYLLVIVAGQARKAGSLRIIVFGVVVAFLSATRDIILLVLVDDPGAIMVSHYGFIVLALASCGFVVYDALGHYRALIVERRRAASFREEALHDELTGCYNRKILPILADDLKKPFSVLAFDIDNFKSINDSFGHATGDAILVDLVRVAQRNIRADDCVVRTGGDEFLLVLRGCPLEVANTIADHLVSDCRQSGVAAVQDASAVNGAPRVVGYTVSAGVAFCCGGEPSFEELTATLQMADRGLYKAKNEGKGGWCVG